MFEEGHDVDDVLALTSDESAEAVSSGVDSNVGSAATTSTALLVAWNSSHKHVMQWQSSNEPSSSNWCPQPTCVRPLCMGTSGSSTSCDAPRPHPWAPAPLSPPPSRKCWLPPVCPRLRKQSNTLQTASPSREHRTSGPLLQFALHHVDGSQDGYNECNNTSGDSAVGAGSGASSSADGVPSSSACYNSHDTGRSANEKDYPIYSPVYCCCMTPALHFNGSPEACSGANHLGQLSGGCRLRRQLLLRADFCLLWQHAEVSQHATSDEYDPGHNRLSAVDVCLHQVDGHMVDSSRA